MSATTERIAQAEHALTVALTDLVANIAAVQTAAHEVVAAGGNARQAFLAAVDDDARPALELQWPMFAVMLGLPVA